MPILRVRAKPDAIVQNRFETFIVVAPNIYMVVQDDAGQLLAKAPPHEARLARVDLEALFQSDPAHGDLKTPGTAGQLFIA